MGSLGKELLLALKEHGAKEIFGIPGDYALQLFETIEKTKILPLYTLSHEPGVGFAADASARMRSSISVACVTYGVGGLNMVNSIAGAYTEKVPIVVVSGAPATGSKNSCFHLHHEVKTLETQAKIYKEITCDQVIIRTIKDAPKQISRVLYNCIKYSRPVYIEIPKDLVYKECAPISKYRKERPNLKLIETCVEEVISKIKTAKHPLIIVGEEIKRYNLISQTAQFVNATGIPIITSMLGMGMFEQEEIPIRGTYKGSLSSEEIKKLVNNSDLIVMLGVFISDANFSPALAEIPENKTIHFFDRTLKIEKTIFPDIEPSIFFDSLLEKAKKHSATGKFVKTKEIFPGKMPSDNKEINPMDIAGGINDIINQFGNIPLSVDIGDCLFVSLGIKDSARITPWYYGSMGNSIPAGLGIQASTGRRPIILVGDGAFEMTGWELCNCRKYGWDPIVIVLNNTSWGMLNAIHPGSKFSSLPKLDFIKIAKALGGTGKKVKTRKQFKSALDDAINNRGKFYMIEVMLSRNSITPALASFGTTTRKQEK